MKKKWFILMFGILALSLLSACASVAEGMAGQAAPATPTAIPPVKASNEIVAEARLVPSDRVTLSFSASGIVSEVNFKEGDLVKTGDVIARLGDQERLAAAVSSATLEVLNAKQALKDLQKSGGALAIAQANLDIANAQDALDDAVTHRNSLTQGHRASADTIDAQKAKLKVAEETLNSRQEYYDSLNDELPADDPGLAKALLLLNEARTNYLNILAGLNWYTGKPTDNEQAVLDATVTLAEARLADAKARQEGLQDGVDPDDIALAEARITNAESQLIAAQATLEDLVLISPFTGTVLHMDLKKGQFVAAASPSVELVDFSVWKLETTDLTELSIVRIRLGDPATITFDALPEVKFAGTVEKIKPLGENVQGDIVYTVVIIPTKDEVWKTWQEQLRWNMTASVTIQK